MVKLAACAMGCFLLAVLASQQQVAAIEMKDRARALLNRYTSSNGFDQLNTLVTSPFGGGSRSADSVFKEIEQFLAKPESKKPRSRELAEAAEQFVRLKRLEGGQACELENLRIVASLAEGLNSGLPESFSSSGPSNTGRRQLLRIFRQLAREKARLCLDKYRSEWAAMRAQPDWFGGREEERRMEQQLAIFQEETNELSCDHKFHSVRPTVRYFECALQAAHAPFSSPEHAHGLKLALERIQLLRDDTQRALARYDASSLSLKLKSARQIGALVEEYLRKPCDQLMANEAGTRLLRAVKLFASMLGLPDELFLQYNAATDHLVKWTGRLVLCERLLEHTDREQLAQALSQSGRL